MKNLLSLSGGGMKGYPACAVLAEIERRSGRRISELFDLAGGTSVGGIVLLSLAAGNSAAATLDFFTQDGPRIFSGNFQRLKLLARGYRFNPAILEAALKQRFKSQFMAGADMKIIIPAVNRIAGDTVFFKSFDFDTNLFPMWQVGRATSAAQTYFPPFNVKEREWSLWDGGNAANNPAACVLAQAVKLWPGEKFRMLSLGCGETNMTPAKGQPGIFDTLRETLSILFESEDGLPDYQMRQVLGADFCKVQPQGISTGLADASPSALALLAGVAKQTVAANEEIINRFCE